MLDFERHTLCLDFANTLDWRGAENPTEKLGTYTDLVDWAERAQVLDPAEATVLRREGRARSGEAGEALDRARSLREHLAAILEQTASSRPAAARDLDALNGWLPAALERLRLEVGEEGFGWSSEHDRYDLDRVLWPVLLSAASLLTSPELKRVRQCASEPCGWFFLDRSRNRSRRWCEMADCGNRAKVRRFRQRQRESA